MDRFLRRRDERSRSPVLIVEGGIRVQKRGPRVSGLQGLTQETETHVDIGKQC